MCILMLRAINISFNIDKAQEWLLVSVNEMMIKLADEGSWRMSMYFLQIPVDW